MLRTHRVRADTTVVAATVCYPTDAGLLGRAIGKLAATIGRIQATGAATRTRVRDRRRSARRRAHQLAKTLRGRSEQANQAVLCTTGELATLAIQAVGDATRVARNARRSLARAAAIPASSTARDPRVAGPAVPWTAARMPDALAGDVWEVPWGPSRLRRRPPAGDTRLPAQEQPQFQGRRP